MTAPVGMIDVGALVPDGIEPVEAFRCWTLSDGKLMSLNGGGADVSWTPGEPLVAKCNASAKQYRWSIERGGMTYEQADGHAKYHNVSRAATSRLLAMSGRYVGSEPQMPAPPKVELPTGYGFCVETETHTAPHEGCTCGIYAATDTNGVPGSGNVYGKVKLWGKVVPGEKGYRAEYGYPSEFRVAPGLENDPALLAFGVPITVDTTLYGAALTPTTAAFRSLAQQQAKACSNYAHLSNYTPATRTQMHWMTKVAIAMNLGACALNVAAGMHLL